MVSDFNPQVINDIRDFYQSDVSAQALFDWTASRERDATATSIDRMCQILEINRGTAVAMAKKLQELGCGEFIPGRHSQKSRFRWKFSCISLGQAASGEQTVLAQAINPIPENEEETAEQKIAPFSAVPHELKLSLAEAKAGLSNMFGVPIVNIEITIKS
jgi:hypothetical protein